MRIAYVMAPVRGDTDLLISGVARKLIGRGYKPAGTVQINTERVTEGPCDMDVQVLPAGPVIRISQDLGRGSRGCRLDPAALEAAVGLVAADLAAGADCLIVNKFGKHEAEGRGFRDVIAEAASGGVPVLIGTNQLNLDQLRAFLGGDAVKLAAREADILHWLLDAMKTAGREAELPAA